MNAENASGAYWKGEIQVGKEVGDKDSMNTMGFKKRVL